MKNLRPIGIPHSIFFEESVRQDLRFHQARRRPGAHPGVLQGQRLLHGARHRTTRSTFVDIGGEGFRFPLIKPNKPGKGADITLTVEEGRLYHLNNINFVGVKLFRTPETLMRPAVPDEARRRLLHRQAAQGL